MSILLFTGCGSEQIALENAQAVRIICEKQSGSGVIYDAGEEHVVIVTAAHVVENAETAKVVYGVEDKNKCKIADIAVVSGLDLAFLRVDNASAGWSVRQNSSRDATQDTFQDPVKEIFLRGRSSSGELWNISGTISEEWIYVEDFCCHMMLGNADASPGISGGGVFDKNGGFYGIVCGMDGENNVAILPASVIVSEYDVIVWE